MKRMVSIGSLYESALDGPELDELGDATRADALQSPCGSQTCANVYGPAVSVSFAMGTVVGGGVGAGLGALTAWLLLRNKGKAAAR